MERYSLSKCLNDSQGKDLGIMPLTSKLMPLHPLTPVYTHYPLKRKRDSENSLRPTSACFKYINQSPLMPAGSFSLKRKMGNLD